MRLPNPTPDTAYWLTRKLWDWKRILSARAGVVLATDYVQDRAPQEIYDLAYVYALLDEADGTVRSSNGLTPPRETPEWVVLHGGRRSAEV